MSSLFSFLNDQVGGAINQIVKQGQVVENSVTNPLKSLVGEVTGGMWKGDGANRFVSEMTSEVIPMLASIMVVNSGFASGITKAQNRMEQAFQQANSAAQTLNDVFSQIF